VAVHAGHVHVTSLRLVGDAAAGDDSAFSMRQQLPCPALQQLWLQAPGGELPEVWQQMLNDTAPSAG
jgi:hypothetical protein